MIPTYRDMPGPDYSAFVPTTDTAEGRLPERLENRDFDCVFRIVRQDYKPYVARPDVRELDAAYRESRIAEFEAKARLGVPLFQEAN